MTFRFGHAVAVTVFAVCTAASAAAMAAGSDSGDDSNKKKKDDPQYSQGVNKVKAKDFQGAIDLLNQVVLRNPKDADAWNYIGFSDRMLGRYDESLAAYEKALAIEPDHIGAHEYLGELYVQTGKTAEARQQLATLERLCGENCDEYRELKGVIGGSKAALLDDAGSTTRW
jgi:tetratricopeptide (TPR) repeat protein